MKLIPPRNHSQQTGVLRQEPKAALNEAKLEEFGRQWRTKSGELENLKKENNAACLKLLLEEANQVSVESLKEVPDPEGHPQIVDEPRELFKNNEIAPLHYIPLENDSYSQLLEASNEEIKLQNEIVGLKRNLPKTEFVRGKSIPEGGFGAANYARSINSQNQIDRKLVTLEELKDKTNEALQNFLLAEQKIREAKNV